MKLAEFLHALLDVRSDEVLVTAMGAAREWPKLSDSPLDLNYAPSSMGQAPPLGAGIALARPGRKVLVVNGDGCTLMNLGSLVTIAELNLPNYLLFNMENGLYEVTGGQPVAGAGQVSFTEIARGAGWKEVHEFSDGEDFRQRIGQLLGLAGPVFINIKVDPEPGPAPKAVRPIPETIARLREALAET